MSTITEALEALDKLRAALLRAERQEPEGERVEGWADTTEADCSCARARTIHFNADCGHGDWGQRATLIIHAEPKEGEGNGLADDTEAVRRGAFIHRGPAVIEGEERLSTEDARLLRDNLWDLYETDAPSASEGEERCPDGGKCHHACTSVAECYRVRNCAPLSEAGETWDRAPSAAEGEERCRVESPLSRCHLPRGHAGQHEGKCGPILSCWVTDDPAPSAAEGEEKNDG